MRLLIGATQLTQPGPGAEVRLIKRLLVHKDYGSADQSNDIALLELNEPVKCSPYVQLVCVPSTTLDVAQLDTCYVAGWGATTARCEFPKMEGKLDALGRGVRLPDSRGQSQSQAAHSLKAGSRDRELQLSGEAKPSPRKVNHPQTGKVAASCWVLIPFCAHSSKIKQCPAGGQGPPYQCPALQQQRVVRGGHPHPQLVCWLPGGWHRHLPGRSM